MIAGSKRKASVLKQLPGNGELKNQDAVNIFLDDKITLDKEESEDEQQSDSSDDSSVYSELESEEDDESTDEEEDEAIDGTEDKKDEKDEGADEYEYDSSDEEDLRNTIGNIPVKWYDDYDHIGYHLDGTQIRKPKRGDELDHFLKKMESGEAGITVKDPHTGQDVVLSEKEIETIKRIAQGKVPDQDYNLYEDLVPWFSSEVLDVPICGVPATKKSFLPSLDEKRQVGKMVHAIKMGWMKTRAEREAQAKKEKEDEFNRKYYMLWKTDEQPEEVKRINDLIPAPKMALPGHAESYNPPPEYIFTEKERKVWEEQEEEPYKRKLNFIPEKHESLRKVPAYRNFTKERFERLMDLYLAPRARKMRLTIQPEDLLPQLPKPKDLKPFPTGRVCTYKGHNNMVRTLSVDPSHEYLASGSDDGTVRVWEIQFRHCTKTFDFGGKTVIRSVQWCPNRALAVLAVAFDNKVVLVNASVGDKVVVHQTNELLLEAPKNEGYVPPERVKNAVTWATPEKSDNLPKEALVLLTMFKPVKQVTWHGKGDYFATVLTEGAANRSVLIHQLSRWRSQVPFSKAKGMIQRVLFHPIRPYLFVATQRQVRIYNLSKQELTKTLRTGAKWISSIAIHPKGDNLLVGTYDKRVLWFDMDLSTLPYKVLRYHHSAVRQVAYHKRYPIFASCADDTSIIVSHGMVYNDLLQNPLIVPVKLLRGHTKYDDLGVMEVIWHPTHPWLFSGGADGYIKLWA